MIRGMSDHEDLEMTDAEKAQLRAARTASEDVRSALDAGDAEGRTAAFRQLMQTLGNMSPGETRNKIHMPDDAGEYEGGLRRIMVRIPDGWGRWISCDRGWYPIIIDLDQQLAAIDPDYVVRQCKEKLGMLRVYVRASASVSEADQQRMRELVRAAQEQAAATCELCGEPGGRHSNSRGWLKTLCSDCAAERGYGRLGELVNDLSPDHRGVWRVTDYAGTESHWDMSRGEVSIVGGERHRGVEVLAPPSVLRTWRLRLADGSEIESGLIAAIERVR